MGKRKNNSGSVLIASFIGVIIVVVVGGVYFWEKNQVKQSDQSTGITTVKAENNSVNAITYEKFTADDIGLSFDVPIGVEVFDTLNGFPNSYKFIYNNDSYLVFYGGFKDGNVNYDSWAGKTDVTITEKANSKIYTENGLANTEAFFLNHEPIVTITIIKQEGTALVGETSSSDDVVYQHLVYSVMFEGTLIF